jgi:hypothetical protein
VNNQEEFDQVVDEWAASVIRLAGALKSMVGTDGMRYLKPVAGCDLRMRRSSSFRGKVARVVLHHR